MLAVHVSSPPRVERLSINPDSLSSKICSSSFHLGKLEETSKQDRLTFVRRLSRLKTQVMPNSSSSLGSGYQLARSVWHSAFHNIQISVHPHSQSNSPAFLN